MASVRLVLTTNKHIQKKVYAECFMLRLVLPHIGDTAVFSHYMQRTAAVETQSVLVSFAANPYATKDNTPPGSILKAPLSATKKVGYSQTKSFQEDIDEKNKCHATLFATDTLLAVCRGTYRARKIDPRGVLLEYIGHVAGLFLSCGVILYLDPIYLHITE